MNIQEILRQLDLGSSVAEFDGALERYFVETDTFRSLVADKADIIAGDKGAGKTALYQYLQRRYAQIPELARVEIITGFNPMGSPIFEALVHAGPLNEGQYITVWKTYLLSLVGNWLLQLCEGAYTHSTGQLELLLDQIGLRSRDDTPQTIFSRLTTWLHQVINPRAAGLELTFDAQGIPILATRVEFSDPHQKVKEPPNKLIPHNQALAVLNAALAENGLTIWVALDRLDEAFVGFPEVELPALRALFRTYLDLLAFSQIRLKLFVRKDLFRKITGDRFVNLTHVNARKQEIIWDEEDLLTLLCKRVRENEEFLNLTHLHQASDQALFERIFPNQVDSGDRKPSTWKWMLARTCDGHGAIPPRNLIDLVNKAKEEQLRREQRNPRPYSSALALIEPDAIKQALTRLSRDRVEDTLLAEVSKDVAVLIKAFSGSKVEHDETSIAKLFGVELVRAKSFANTLLDIGFFEQVGQGYRIPILYRDGLNITQGKAF